ncbi:MAG TPA: hypothetical protein VHN99_08640 [Deinococcales bacterium]|nr:hypothetical protein [Deinococcales bacterium]
MYRQPISRGLAAAGALLALALAGCDRETDLPPAMMVLLENTAGGASGATPCTGGLQARTATDHTPVIVAGTSLVTYLHYGSPDEPVDAYCDTGSGTPGHSQLSIRTARDRILRVTAPDGQPHAYVLTEPGPVIEVLK